MSEQKAISRRTALQLGLGAMAGAVGGVVLASSAPGGPPAEACAATPAQMEGPFYPDRDQPDKDLDLTHLEGGTGRAEGDVIYVEGRVLDDDCQPVPGALVEIWQANKWGRYRHTGDTNTAPLDPHFQGWGQVVSDEEGRYRFKTIVPGAYPAEDGWVRPPHIHFKVARRGYHELITQMYFAGEALNDEDLILREVPAEERARVVVALEPPPPGAEPEARCCRFDLVVRRVRRG
jgi:protocatechuate 3,4-dioxygenase beta subunit